MSAVAVAGGDSSGEEGGLQIDVGRTEGSNGGGGKKEPNKGKVRKPGRKKTAAKVEPVDWKAGDIVWAKVSGFNYWPAKVFDGADREAVPKWLSQPPKPNYTLVRFFGSYDMLWVSQRLIESYERGFKKKFQNKCRSKLFQKSVKEVQEYLDKGVTPEGLLQPIVDPDAHSDEEEEEEEEGEEEMGVASDDAPSSEAVNDKTVKKTKTKDPSPPPVAKTTDQEAPPTQTTNGNRSRRRKGSPRRLSSSSADNDEGGAVKKAKLDTVDEVGGAKTAAAKDGKTEHIEAFTSAPLPLTSNSKKSSRTKAVKA